MSVNKYIIKTVVGLKGKLPGTRDSICELILSNKITIVRPARQPKTCNSEHCKLNKDQNKQIDSKSDTVDKEKVEIQTRRHQLLGLLYIIFNKVR